MNTKFTIGVVTFNTLFYTKLQLLKLREHTYPYTYDIMVYDNGSTDGTREWLAEQDDVTLFNSPVPNSMTHGHALDFLAKKAKHPIFCALDADAFPLCDRWIEPGSALNGDIVLAGIDRTWGYTLKKGYIHPSYLFGWTDWVRKFSFSHEWPAEGNKYDTGEKVTEGVLKAGKQVRSWKPKMVDFDGRFRAKPCDYDSLVWHVWWASRLKREPHLKGKEFEEGYHEFCEQFFREKYHLDF